MTSNAAPRSRPMARYFGLLVEPSPQSADEIDKQEFVAEEFLAVRCSGAITKIASQYHPAR
jgi:hypothetical protein